MNNKKERSELRELELKIPSEYVYIGQSAPNKDGYVIFGEQHGLVLEDGNILSSDTNNPFEDGSNKSGILSEDE